MQAKTPLVAVPASVSALVGLLLCALLRSLLAEPPPAGRALQIDTRAATFAGAQFKHDGASVIDVLPFTDEAQRRAALAEFANFMQPPRKNAMMQLAMPGVDGVTLRFNPYTGALAHLVVTSAAVRTTENLGVGNTIEEFTAVYGKPVTTSYSNGVVSYRFNTANPALTLLMRVGTNPVTSFEVIYDLKRG